MAVVVALEPASRRSHAELAEIFSAGYEDYYTPFTVDEVAFRFMSELWDDDVDASRVAVVDGDPAGIAKLAIRGDRGWIAGVGVAVPHRGKGLGEQLMRAVIEGARARGLREIWLEVLVQNEPAIRLYEKLGFGTVRELEVWTLENLQDGEPLVASAEEAHARIRAGRASREPWQRADETVANSTGLEGVVHEDGSLLFRRSGDRLSLLQGLASDQAAAERLLRSLPPETTASSG